MSARDAESGSSTYKGGSGQAGGLGNGGIGGGMGGGGNWGGGMGGGAGRNGGIGNRTGLRTGNVMKGVAGRNGLTFSGRPGGFAREPGAWGITPAAPIGTGPLSGVRRPGASAIPAYAPPAWAPPYSQMPPLYDVQPGVPPLTTPETVPGVPTPPTNPPDYNPNLLQAYRSPYGPEMVGQWGSGIKDKWHNAYGIDHPGYDRGY